VHDVAIQNLPVRFAIDRAGLVGADGATHAGSFDIAYLGCLPNFILMAAANEIDLQNMVTTAALMNEQPIAFRYPRGEGVGLVMPEQGVALPIGKGEIVKQGNDIAIFSYGTRLSDALIAADFLEKEHNISVTIANARFAKPLDIDMLQQLSSHHSVFITIEEGSGGGFGAIVLQTMAHMNLLDGRTHIIPMYLPDVFQDHNTPHAMYDEARLNAHHIIDKVLSLGLKKQSKKLSLTTT
jgi:1-deoxy-D-xylulose-5-phosphate synthase